MHDQLMIMVIDDDETDNLITTRIIEMGHLASKVFCFTSARKAIQHLQTNSGNPDALPDIIFLDIQMPMMSGTDFLKALEKMAPDLARDPKIVVLSAYEKASDASLKSDRIIDYLPKPLMAGDFKRIVKEFTTPVLKSA